MIRDRRDAVRAAALVNVFFYVRRECLELISQGPANYFRSGTLYAYIQQILNLCLDNHMYSSFFLELSKHVM